MKTDHLTNPEIRAAANALADTYRRIAGIPPSAMASAILTLTEGGCHEEYQLTPFNHQPVLEAGARSSEDAPASPSPGRMGPIFNALLAVQIAGGTP